MGNAVNTNVNTTVQTNLNRITQTSIANCGANCTQLQSGNTVFLDNSTTGNIEFVQRCTMSADCQIKNSVQAAATAVQQAITNATAKPGWFIGNQINTNVNTTVQVAENVINQTLVSTCNTNANQTQTGNLVFARNSQTGNISFLQDTDTQLQCVLSNLAKGTAATTQKADTFAEAGGIGSAGIIGALLVIALIVIVLAVVTRVGKKTSGEKEEEKRRRQQAQMQQSQQLQPPPRQVTQRAPAIGAQRLPPIPSR